MHTSDEWYVLAGQRRRELARQMVRMEILADRYESEGQYQRAQAVRHDRELVAVERSELMREMWAMRRTVAV